MNTAMRPLSMMRRASAVLSATAILSECFSAKRCSVSASRRNCLGV